jgi:hypothetical protein
MGCCTYREAKEGQSSPGIHIPAASGFEFWVEVRNKHEGFHNEIYQNYSGSGSKFSKFFNQR